MKEICQVEIAEVSGGVLKEIIVGVLSGAMWDGVKEAYKALDAATRGDGSSNFEMTPSLEALNGGNLGA